MKTIEPLDKSLENFMLKQCARYPELTCRQNRKAHRNDIHALFCTDVLKHLKAT